MPVVKPPSATRNFGARCRRRGFILIPVILCLGIAAALMGTVIARSLSARESLRAAAWQLQAQWLAESAMERAAAQLAADANYLGEQWAVSAEQLGGTDDGVATIRVENAPETPDARVIHVQADFPNDPVHRCRQTKQITIALSH
jgi:type II secretory pathway pseudopilin PulG